MSTDSLYGKIFDTLLEVRDVRERFKTYSARDINALIASKMKSVREPAALRHLYDLEARIAEVRVALRDARADAMEAKTTTAATVLLTGEESPS